MSSGSSSSQADGCGCCEGITKITPIAIQNPPSLSSIGFRVGIQPEFKETMIANLNKYQALVPLTTRSDDDLSIDLLDAWATVADVLTFYQERIANEGFLRTAKERVSVLQLARSIGYELSPGVAASAYLAFMLDTSGSVTQTTIGSGTKVMSLPSQGKSPPETPQTFETIESIVAYPQFNALKPRLTKPQMLDHIQTARAADGLDHVYFTGTNTKLNPGDKLLFVRVSDGAPVAFRTVSSATPNSPSPQQTDVALINDSQPVTFQDFSTPFSPLHAILIGPPPKFPARVKDLTLPEVQLIINKYPGQSDLVAFLTGQGWDYMEFAGVVNSFARSLDTSATDVRVYAMRVKTGVFGNTAPNYNTLSSTLTQPPTVSTYVSASSAASQQVLSVANTNGFLVGATVVIDSGGSNQESATIASIQPGISLTMSSGLAQSHNSYEPVTMVTSAVYPNNWDDPSSPYPADRDSQGQAYLDDSTIYLGSSYPGIAPNGWSLLRGHDATGGYTTCAYAISDAWEESRADFLVNAKVTGLKLSLGSVIPLSDFTMRGTTVYAQSEELELADLPDEDPIQGNQILLGSVVAGLEVGQSIAVTGMLSLQSGQSSSETVSEVVSIAAVTPYAPGRPFTEISVASLASSTTGLANSYERATFVINANVALATHGSTVSNEILGGGDPSQPYLTFNLKQDPLTFVSSPTSPSGAQTTLQVWVSNGGANLLWNQAPNLYDLSPKSRSYAVRIQDDSSVSVLFGNARPPVGAENVTATYRVGIGASGMVQANQLTLLASRPLGLKSVTNPLASTGAADPENLSDARRNAPLQVLTMGRIVSLTDCENFARSFQGIGKAAAVSAWAGETKYVRLVVASAMEGTVGEPLLGYLQTAITNFADPAVEVSVEQFVRLTFNIAGWIITAADHDSSAVQNNVLAALRTAFSFEAMDFGQPVYLSDVIATIQKVDGVVATDVTSLYLTSASAPEANDTLACDIDGLLILNPDPQGVDLEERTS